MVKSKDDTNPAQADSTQSKLPPEDMTCRLGGFRYAHCNNPRAHAPARLSPSGLCLRSEVLLSHLCNVGVAGQGCRCLSLMDRFCGEEFAGNVAEFAGSLRSTAAQAHQWNAKVKGPLRELLHRAVVRSGVSRKEEMSFALCDDDGVLFRSMCAEHDDEWAVTAEDEPWIVASNPRQLLHIRPCPILVTGVSDRIRKASADDGVPRQFKKSHRAHDVLQVNGRFKKYQDTLSAIGKELTDGSQETEEIVEKLHLHFPFGEWTKVRDKGAGVVHCGNQVRVLKEQCEEYIELNQQQFTDGRWGLIEINDYHKNCDAEDTASRKETSGFRATCGSLWWLSNQIRAGTSFSVYLLQKRTCDLRVRNLLLVNELAKHVQKTPSVGLVFRNLGRKVAVAVWHDSSLYNSFGGEIDIEGDYEVQTVGAKTCVRSSMDTMVGVVRIADIELDSSVSVCFCDWIPRTNRRMAESSFA
jgi:hypothetical protein